MTEPESRTGGSHRRTDSRRLLKLLGSLLIVVIAAGGVVAALHWRGESSKPDTAAAATHTSSFSPPTGTPHASDSTPASSAPAVVAPVSTTPAAVTEPASSSAAAPTPTPTPSAKPTPTASPSVVRPPVDIFNDTHISGLAASAAKTLTSGGWTVAETGNYPHSISTTTVYYPAGQLAAAQQLAHQYTSIRAVLPAPSGLSTTDLTLVLATDWTSNGR